MVIKKNSIVTDLTNRRSAADFLWVFVKRVSAVCTLIRIIA